MLLGMFRELVLSVVVGGGVVASQAGLEAGQTFRGQLRRAEEPGRARIAPVVARVFLVAVIAACVSRRNRLPT